MCTSSEDYQEWRLDLEDERRREEELRADAAEVKRDAALRAQGMEPMPPRRAPGVPTADVIATGAVRCLAVPRDLLRQAVEAEPVLGWELLEVLGERLRDD